MGGEELPASDGYNAHMDEMSEMLADRKKKRGDMGPDDYEGDAGRRGERPVMPDEMPTWDATGQRVTPDELQRRQMEINALKAELQNELGRLKAQRKHGESSTDQLLRLILAELQEHNRRGEKIVHVLTQPETTATVDPHEFVTMQKQIGRLFDRITDIERQITAARPQRW